MQILPSAKDTFGVGLLVPVEIGVENNVQIGPAGRAATGAVSKDAGRRAQHIAGEVPDRHGAVARDDAGEHVLHKIFDVIIMADPPPEKADQPSANGLRFASKCRMTDPIRVAALHLTAPSHKRPGFAKSRR